MYVDRKRVNPNCIIESIILTQNVETKEERYVMTSYVPKAFIQTDIPK